MSAKNTEKPAKIPSFAKSEMLPLFIAYNVDPKCGAPREAKSRSGDVTYKGNVLTLDGRDVIKFVRLKKQLVMLYQRGVSWTRQGWVSSSLDSELRCLRHAYVLQYPATDLKLSFKMLHAALWNHPTNDDNVTLQLHMAKLCGYSIKAMKAPPRQHFAGKFVPPAPYTGSTIVDKAQRIVEWYSPGARKRRAEEQREQAFRQSMTNLRWRVLTPFRQRRDALNNDIHRLNDKTCTVEQLLNFFGYDPKPGDMFKRVYHSINMHADGTPIAQSKSQSFKWPKVGGWTVPVQGVRACSSGYHLTPATYIFSWNDWGPHLYLAEGTGRMDVNKDKTAYESARLVKYLGEITAENILAARSGQTDRLAELADLKSALAHVEGDIRYIEQGYGDCLAKFDAQHNYVRFEIGKNLGGNTPFGAGLKAV